MRNHDFINEEEVEENDSNNNVANCASHHSSRKMAAVEDGPHPLLTASLNTPPVHVTASSHANHSISANGSMDLSSHASSIRKRLNGGCEPVAAEVAADPTASSPTSSSKEMYANLLMQLRNQGITTAAAASNVTIRKEKLKPQMCFQCPVCKKRFQRHIAMNAHFQAEHLGLTPKNDKICKLCTYVGHDMGSIRHHLIIKHSIDLDSPTACLVEPDMSSPASSPCSRSASSSPLPSSSSDKKTSHKHNFSNNSAVSITRTSIVPKTEDGLVASSSSTSSVSRNSPTAASVNVVINEASGSPNLVKQERPQSRETDVTMLMVEEAKDLSMKKTVLPKRSASPYSDCSSSAATTSTTAASAKKARQQQRIVMPQPSMSPVGGLSHPHQSYESSNSCLVMTPGNTSQWQCQHCNIIFPDQTLYFLHKMFHSNTNPWKCNGCGQRCTDMYDFNTHLMSDVHH